MLLHSRGFFIEESVQNPRGVSIQKLQWVKIISGCVGFIFLILNNYVNNSGAVDKTLNDRSLKLQIQVSLKFFKILIYKEPFWELAWNTASLIVGS